MATDIRTCFNPYSYSRYSLNRPMNRLLARIFNFRSAGPSGATNMQDDNGPVYRYPDVPLAKRSSYIHFGLIDRLRILASGKSVFHVHVYGTNEEDGRLEIDTHFATLPPNYAIRHH